MLMNLDEKGWLIALGALLLLLNSGVRRLLASTLTWAALAVFLYGVFQAYGHSFEKGVAQLITWSLIAGALAVAGRIISPRRSRAGSSSTHCLQCGGTRRVMCHCEFARGTGLTVCHECHGSRWKPCPSCR
jgi:membrane protein implicated in regulation of membrane protease activity